jgi:hypothetical protein
MLQLLLPLLIITYSSRHISHLSPIPRRRCSCTDPSTPQQTPFASSTIRFYAYSHHRAGQNAHCQTLQHCETEERRQPIIARPSQFFQGISPLFNGKQEHLPAWVNMFWSLCTNALWQESTYIIIDDHTQTASLLLSPQSQK